MGLEEDCGCKGIRYCAICINSERVKNLTSSSPAFENFTKYVFSSTHRVAVRYEFPASGKHPTVDLVEMAREDVNEKNFPEDDFIGFPGLIFFENFLTPEHEENLIKLMDKKEWVLSQSGRRKQEYGPKVNFKHKKVKMDKFIGMPDYIDSILTRMSELSPDLLGHYQPFELCNLEYVGERLSAIEMHFDDSWIWGNRLISINLLSPTVLSYANEEKKALVYVHVPRRALVCMADEVRYKWKHAVLSDHIKGRRIALTMREPSPIFQEGGDLHEKFGKELIRLGNIRVKN